MKNKIMKNQLKQFKSMKPMFIMVYADKHKTPFYSKSQVEMLIECLRGVK